MQINKDNIAQVLINNPSVGFSLLGQNATGESVLATLAINIQNAITTNLQLQQQIAAHQPSTSKPRGGQ